MALTHHTAVSAPVTFILGRKNVYSAFVATPDRRRVKTPWVTLSEINSGGDKFGGETNNFSKTPWQLF